MPTAGPASAGPAVFHEYLRGRPVAPITRTSDVTMEAAARTAEVAPAPGRAARGVIVAYAAVLCAASGFAALSSDSTRLIDRPLLLVALVACMLVLHTLEFDLFGRGHISPATVPTLSIAALFGPAGIVIAEGAAALLCLLRRDPALRATFDFGALSLCGIVAAGVFALGPSHAPGLLLSGALAGAAYYVVNSVLLAAVWWLHEGVAPLAAWRERLAWVAPHYPAYGLLAALLIVGHHGLGLYVFAVVGVPVTLVWLGQRQYLERSRRNVEEMRAVLDEKQALLERVQRSYLQTITSLARTIEAKDPYTGGHVERVADYAVALARELGFDEEALAAVAVGSIVHDIGKVGIPDQVLLKPGRLDDAEWAEMQRHPRISSYILDELELPDVVKQMARHHHERYDGRGYPDGLAGEAIPLAARILSVADALDAMTSDRLYRGALSFEQAVSEIRRHAGSQYCPRVVGALDAAIARDPGSWRGETRTSLEQASARPPASHGGADPGPRWIATA
jgi:hypothetical protein